MKPLARLLALQENPRAVLACAGILIAVIAVVDWLNTVNYFGFLYVFPMLLVGTVLRGWQIALTAIFCTVLAELFDPFVFEPGHVLSAGHVAFHRARRNGIVFP